MTSFGKLNVEKEHCLTFTNTPFSASVYLQELSCFTGSQLVFEDASRMLEFISRIKISSKQIERISHYHGEQIEKAIKEKVQTGADKIYPDNDELYYVMMDGSMYLTREEKWKEIKLGRIFKASDNFEISKNRGLVTKSEYVCHLGEHTDFLDKLGVYTESLKNPVFINDGARWIWNWVETYYPSSVQILDFFHAKEHLCQFASEYFQNKEERKDWVEERCGQLLDDKIELVIDGLKELPVKNRKISELKISLINYYQTNLKRMKYKTFIDKNLRIGSGAIEAAHRDILQQRLKLSGQRWTKKGIQEIANLRILYKSNKLDNNRNLLNHAA
jgi:hypothetical protein